MTTEDDDQESRVVETHISTLFFAGDRVYKLAKRVDLPFLHAVDVDHRLRLAAREVELNRRFAPDVYLGVADVIEQGVLADRMVVMRRLPASRCLARLVTDAVAGSGMVPNELLRSVARHVAAIHSNAPPITDGSTANSKRLAQNWTDNFTALRPHVGSIIGPAEFASVHDLADTYLRQCRSLFDQRIVDGFVRDGHGDLVADDIYCLDDGPRLLDCLAFDDDLRIGDVLNDIAFLAMDLHRLAGPDVARSLMNSYHEFTNEQHPPSLAHHYVAYRAHVRAKVACVRAAQGDDGSSDLARSYHALALHHLERAQLRVILIGGGPGVGKTLLAQRLADHYGHVHLATDDIRHDVARVPHGQHAFADPDQGAYDPAITDATYAEQLREAHALIDAGYGVVLDATWASERHRAAVRSSMLARGVGTIEVECAVEDDIARERIARRLGNPDNPDNPDNASDATPDLVDVLRGRRDAWPTATVVSTLPALDIVVARTVRVINGAR